MPVDEELFAGNRLLGVLTGQVRAGLAGLGTLADLEFKEMLYEQGGRIDRVFFPLSGVMSLVSMMEDGRGVEIATVGSEGFVGLPVFLQSTLTSSHRAFAQIPGRAIVFGAAEFLEASNSSGPFHAVLQRYAHALISQIAQGAACNRLHALEQRAARWMLQTHDRVDGDHFPLTQEFLAQMLGVGRQAVNEAERALQDQQLITYTRGVVTVRDRAGLEAATCECYRSISAEFDRLLPPAR